MGASSDQKPEQPWPNPDINHERSRQFSSHWKLKRVSHASNTPGDFTQKLLFNNVFVPPKKSLALQCQNKWNLRLDYWLFDYYYRLCRNAELDL
jgi:hypothetical protein